VDGTNDTRVEGDAEEQATVAETPGAIRSVDKTNVRAVSADAAEGVAEDGNPTTERRARTLSQDELTTVASPSDAMRRDEIARVRIFARLMIGLGVFGLAVSPLVGGWGTAKFIFIASVLAVIGAYTALLTLTRNPERYTENLVGVIAQVCALSATGTVYFFGVYSAAPMVVTVGLYVYAMGAGSRWCLITYVHLAVGQAVVAGLVIAEVIPDLGLVQGGYMKLSDQVVLQFCIQFVYFMSYLIARASQTKTLATITELEGAVREIAQRDALLNEARLELERAGWATGPGRFTDQELGSFRLGDVIGRGGMGEIYEAEHLDSGQLAAVKLLQRHVLSNPQHVARFAREANIAAQLKSPYLVKVLEVSDDTAPIPYLAMERLEGDDLATHLRKRRRLTTREVVDLVDQISLGLEAARLGGIVHRDLKPQNLFLAEYPRAKPIWKALDFGVSKLVGHDGTLTRDHVVGTPGYMSPEQARGGDVDHRADVYGLSAIAYRALTGRPLFTGGDVPSILYAVVHRMPQRPSLLFELETDVDDVLAIGLAKKRDERFDTAGELAHALKSASRGRLEHKYRVRAQRLLEANPWGGGV